MENNNSLIEAIAANAADITFTSGVLSIAVGYGTFPSMLVSNIANFTKITGVAETLQVKTSTNATIANSTYYELVITQNVGAANGAPTTFTAFYTSKASGAVEQDVVDAFIAQINGQTGTGEIKVTATDGGANVVTLTARAGYPLFTATGVSNVTVTASVTGVIGRGVGADMITAGISGAVSGHLYTQYIFDFYSVANAQMGDKVSAGLNTQTLYVYQSDTDFAAFDAQLRGDIASILPTIVSNSFSPRCINVGSTAAQLAADGNNSTPVNTEVYIGELFVPRTVFATGIAVFNGSDVTDNIKVGLADSTGAVVATSISTAGSGTDAYQLVPFVTPLMLAPGTYYVLTMYAAGTSRYNAFAVGAFGASKQTGQVFATGFTTITPPTTFTTNLANIAGLY